MPVRVIVSGKLVFVLQETGWVADDHDNDDDILSERREQKTPVMMFSDFQNRFCTQIKKCIM